MGPCGRGLLDTHRPLPLQSLLAMSPEKRKVAAQEGRLAEPPPEEQPEEKLHTLEEFSYEFFRYAPSPPPRPTPTSPWVLPGGWEAMKAGAVPTWPSGAGRGPAQRPSPELGAISPLCAHGRQWGEDRHKEGLLPSQGPREGDTQQSHAPHGPNPGPPVGPLT